MFPMMPSQMKGTHAFRASNASVGAAHTLSGAVSKAPVGESCGQAHQQPTPPLHAFRGEADPETDLSDHGVGVLTHDPEFLPYPCTYSMRFSQSSLESPTSCVGPPHLW